jgi:molecular chaperone HtpG
MNSFTHKTIIGKDVIESLTLGMYEDPRVIFREYVQNAADQIDKAVALGILSSKEDGGIFIDIQKEGRRIVIEDDATGIQQEYAVAILKNIARSDKQRGGAERGFRGIGRLGGLAYCESLMFETSYQGENTKTTLIWDANTLKHIINNRTQKEEASEVIDEITDFSHESEDVNKHYFRVTLKGVSSDILLNVKDIREYLSMVAPVPLSSKFTFISEFKRVLREKELFIDEYCLYINGDRIDKAYTTKIYDERGGSKVELSEIKEIEFFDYYDNTGELLCFGWYGIWELSQQIPKQFNPARGFRLRKGNIQIGDEYCLVKLHKEPRGNFYFFGEVHATHSKLIPNARRDYFLENPYCSLLEEKLRDLFHKLYKSYHFSAKIRSAKRQVDDFEEREQNFSIQEKKGFINKDQFDSEIKSLEDHEVKADKAKKELDRFYEKAQEDSSLRRIFKVITGTEVTDDSERVSLFPRQNENEVEETKTISVTTTVSSETRVTNRNYSKTHNSLNSISGRQVREERTETLKIEEEEEEETVTKVIKPKLIFVDDDTLPRCSKEERKLILKIFTVVDQCLPDKKIVENIRLKIIEEFNKPKDSRK